MHYNFEIPKQVRSEKKSEKTEVFPANERELTHRLTPDQRFAYKYGGVKKRSVAKTRSITPTPYGQTTLLGRFAREYYQAKGHLPYYLNDEPMDDYAGMDGIYPQHWKLYPNPVCCFFDKVVDNEVIFSSKVAAKPDNNYVDDDFTLAPAVFAGNEYDEWTIYNNYQDNWNFFNTRRTDDRGNWDPIHDLVSSFFLSTFGEATWDDIENYYGWIAYQLWNLLTEGYTTRQPSFTVSVGTAYKLFCSLLDMTDADIGDGILYYHRGSQTYQQVILGDEFGIKLTKFKVLCPIEIIGRKEEYRKTRNISYRLKVNWSYTHVNQGITYGVLLRDGIEYCAELDSNGFALAYIPEELDWSDAQPDPDSDDPTYIVKTFEFQAPIHVNFVGLVMNQASTTNTVYETTKSIGLAFLRDQIFYHDSHSCEDCAFIAGGFRNGILKYPYDVIHDDDFTTPTLVTFPVYNGKVNQWCLENSLGLVGEDGVGKGYIESCTMHHEGSSSGNLTMPMLSWGYNYHNRLMLGMRCANGMGIDYMSMSATLMIKRTGQGTFYESDPAYLTINRLRLYLIKVGDIGTAGGSYLDLTAAGWTPTISHKTRSSYYWTNVYTFYWGAMPESVKQDIYTFLENKTGDYEVCLAYDPNCAADKVNGGDVQFGYRIVDLSVYSRSHDQDISGLQVYPGNLNDCWSPENLCYIGKLAKPLGTAQLVITSTVMNDAYPRLEMRTRLRDVVTMSVLKRIWSRPMSPVNAAKILRYCQSEDGLQTDMEVLRHLVTEATAVRAVRTQNIFTGLKAGLSIVVDDAVQVKDMLVGSMSAASAIVSQVHFATPENLPVLPSEVSALVTEAYGAAYTSADPACQAYLVAHLRDVASEVDETKQAAIESAVTYWSNYLDLCYDQELVIPDLKPYESLFTDAVGTAVQVNAQKYLDALNALQVPCDADFARDNKALASFVTYDEETQTYNVSLGQWLGDIKIGDLGVADDDFYQTTGYTSNTTLKQMIAEYHVMTDEQAVSDEYDSTKLDAVQLFLKQMNASVADEYASLSAALLNYKLEECFDDIADDEALITSDDAMTQITAKVDEIKNNLITSMSDDLAAMSNVSSALGDEARHVSALIKTKFASLAETSAQKARSYYSQLVAQFTEIKEGIQQLTSVLSFSVTNMVEMVRSNVSDVQTFLQQMVGAAPNDVAQYGWQSSTLFTPRSGISMALGVAKSGLMGAISAVFGMVGKVVSGAANKIRSAVMTVFEDGCSFRRRGSGYNTLALQAATANYDHEYLRTHFPSLHTKLFYEGASGAMLRGDNSTYVASQIGPLFVFLQDYTNESGDIQTMVTVNPAIIDEDDTLKDNHDYTFANRMAESIIHSILFMNGIVDLMQSLGIDGSADLMKYDVPTVNDLLECIHEKAVGTSSAAAWGWRGLILGLGVALGAILCCTGYGTAAGIALIAGVTIAAECMTAGTAVDQTKIEHLQNDKAYANATILASDLASIWTSSMPYSSLKLACYILDLFSNFNYDNKYYDLVHDGRGMALDLDELIGTESGSNPGEIGYIPMIEGAKRPNFRYSLVTDTQRMAISLAGAVALSIPVFMLAKKAVVATAQKVINKIQAKMEAEQWASKSPEEGDFTSEVNIYDSDGKITGTKKVFDSKAYAAAQKKYKRKMSKLCYKTNKLSGICLTEANSHDSNSIVESFLTPVIAKIDGSQDTTDLIQSLVNRVG